MATPVSTQLMPPTISSPADSVPLCTAASPVTMDDRHKLARSHSANTAQLQYLDSGATEHISNCSTTMTNYAPLHPHIPIKIADDKSIAAIGKGNICFTTDQGKLLELQDVLYAPDCAYNLISVRKLTCNNNDVVFKKGGTECEILDAMGNLLARALITSDNRLYCLQTNEECNRSHDIIINDNSNNRSTSLMTPANPVGHHRTPSTAELYLEHLRKGHVNFDRVKSFLIAQKQATGNEAKAIRDIAPPVCEACELAKHHRTAFTKHMVGTRAVEDNYRIHMDIKVVNQQSIGGAKYFAVFIDDKSRYGYVSILKQKSDLLDAFIELKNKIERQHDKPIKKLRCDNAGENTSDEFIAALKSCGIEYELTMPYTPQQDGVAERRMRSLWELTLAMLFHAKLSMEYWAYAVTHANDILNMMPSSALPENASPHQVRFSAHPKDTLRVFGCPAFMHIPKERRTGYGGRRSLKVIYVGNAREHSGYVLFDPVTRQQHVSRDVTFDETFQSGQGQGRLATLGNGQPLQSIQPQISNKDDGPMIAELAPSDSTAPILPQTQVGLQWEPNAFPDSTRDSTANGVVNEWENLIPPDSNVDNNIGASC
jgi:hypothetical protein